MLAAVNVRKLTGSSTRSSANSREDSSEEAGSETADLVMIGHGARTEEVQLCELAVLKQTRVLVMSL